MIERIVKTGARLELATKRHARELARVIRAEDKEEIQATGGFVPEPAIRMSINRSDEAYALYVGPQLLAVFGVAQLQPNVEIVAVWALLSTHVKAHRKAFWQCSKIVIEYLRGKYPVMTNMVHGHNKAALAWTKRLGFVHAPPEQFGVKGDLFFRITMITLPLEVA